jgi:lysophospholipase L1-like esterase
LAGYVNWTTFYSLGKFYLPQLGSNGLGPTGWAQGVSGNKTTDVITRISNVGAAKPAITTVMLGINDIILASSSSAVIIANLQGIYATINSYGSYVFVITILPATPAGWTARSETTRQAVNSWVLSQAGQVGIAGVLNGDNVITNISTQLQSDMLHPNAAGAQALGQAVGTALLSLVSSSSILYDPLNIPSSNLIPNPLFTGGTTFATSWGYFASGSGMTNVPSKVTFDGTTAQQIVLGGTATANTADLIYQFVTLTGGLVGQSYEAWVEFNCTGLTGITGIELAVNRTQQQIFSVSSQIAATGMSFPFTGVLRSPSFALTSNGQQIQWALSFIPSGGGAAVAGQFTITKAGLRQVPAGQ